MAREAQSQKPVFLQPGPGSEGRLSPLQPSCVWGVGTNHSTPLLVHMACSTQGFNNPDDDSLADCAAIACEILVP